MAERDDAAYIEHLEAQIKKLEKEIARLQKEKGLSSAREGLTYSDHTGLWADKAGGLLYCSTCLAEEKRHPMKKELPHGWRCSVVPKHYFSNPDYEPPVVNLDDGGPQGWMR